MTTINQFVKGLDPDEIKTEMLKIAQEALKRHVGYIAPRSSQNTVWGAQQAAATLEAALSEAISVFASHDGHTLKNAKFLWELLHNARYFEMTTNCALKLGFTYLDIPYPTSAKQLVDKFGDDFSHFVSTYVRPDFSKNAHFSFADSIFFEDMASDQDCFMCDRKYWDLRYKLRIDGFYNVTANCAYCSTNSALHYTYPIDMVAWRVKPLDFGFVKVVKRRGEKCKG